MKKYNFFRVINITTILIVLIFILVSKSSGDIYKYSVVGTLYEIVWLPLIAILFASPCVWLFLMFKKYIEPKVGLIYAFISIIFIVYLTLFSDL